MDFSGGDNDGLIQPSPRIPRKKRGNTPHHQSNNSIGNYSSHRSNSSGSSQKRGSNNSNQIHNIAGRRAGNRIKTPTASSSPNLDDIYSDNSPNHRGSSGNRGGRVPRVYTENDSSDSSRFSSTDSKTAQTSDDDNNKNQQKLRRKREKEKKQRQRDKELRKKQDQIGKLKESQRQRDAEPECIDLEEDDNFSTQGCFDGVVIDKPANPQAKELMNRWKDNLPIAEDDNEETDDARGRGKDKKHFRGANHNSSLVHPLDQTSPDRMPRKDRGKREYSMRQEQGGRVFNSKEEDPLDQAASQQAANRSRSGKVAIEAPSLKQAYTKSMGGNMSKLLNSNASMTSNRSKRKKKPDKNEKREQCARAAISRSDSMDSSSSEGGHKLSSGEKRKPQYGDTQSSKKRRSRDSSEHSAIDVDGDEILNAVSAAGGQRYTPPPQSSVSRADTALNTNSFGIKKAPASIKTTTKNKKKSSPIKSIHTHLKGTKRRDDIDGFDDKPKQKKANKTMSKMRRNGAVLEDESDNGPVKDGWYDPITEKSKPESRGRRKKNTQSQLSDYNTTSASTRTTRSRSRTRGGKKKENEVIEIDDSSSDEGDDTSTSETFAEQSARSMRAVGDVASIDAVRIAIGKKVFRAKCMLSFQFGTKSPYIQFSFESKGKSKVKKSEHRVYLKSEDLKEVKYHIPDELDNSDENDEDSMTVIAFRITPTENNDLEKYSSSYKQVDSDDDQNNHKRYISVEVRDADDFKAMLEQMRQHPDLGHWCTEDSEIEFYNLDKYTKALVDDSRKERNERMSVSRRTRSGGSKKKKDSENKLLVVYPFGVDEAILSQAASGLKELGGDFLGLDDMDDTKPPAASAMQCVQSDVENDGKGKSTRTHYVTIRDDDVERLCPGEFLNDTLVDFWMRWISRGEANNPDSNVHFFTSHFMTTLKNDGPESVASWTAKKKINVFQKKLIFIPVNADLHWSLCVVVNPGLIANCFDESVEETEEHACLLFLDSLKMHSKNMYAKHIRKWLNTEWKRLGRGSIAGKDEPFLLKTIPLLSPKIPYQENGCDCGVFVNRYAYNLFLMRHLKFTWVDIKEHCKSMITRGPAFQFDMEDIARIRGEIGTLINNLSEIYLAMKAEEKKEKKKLKQVVKSSEEEKQSDIGNEDNNTGAPEKSDTPSDSSTALESGETAAQEMNDGVGVAGDGDASDANMPPSEEKENVVQDESQNSVVEVGKTEKLTIGNEGEVDLIESPDV